MSGRRNAPANYDRQLQPIQQDKPPGRSKCMTCVCFTWKVFTCVFSHVTLVTLVVAYCVLGAFTFEHLEAKNELDVKRGIKWIRGNVTEEIWRMTDSARVLHPENWTAAVLVKLQKFEADIIAKMKTDGWDGNEELDSVQWTRTGALFYSIIVITTIGYGHIAPKTLMGKISTIFYAILGIPLMLLCLSNIGDIMASSFRFLYWRVCCYVCTREPKHKHKRRHRPTRQASQLSGRHVANFRSSVRTSQRSADSGFDPYSDTGLTHSYSDNDCRYGGDFEHPLYYDEQEKIGRDRGSTLPNPQRSYNRSQQLIPAPSPRYPRNGYPRERHTVDRERFPGYNEPGDFRDEEMPGHRRSGNRREPVPDREYPSPPQQRRPMRHSEDRDVRGFSHMRQSTRNRDREGAALRVASLDRRMMRRDPVMLGGDQEPPLKTPVLFNKYALDDRGERAYSENKRPPHSRSHSMPRQTSRYGDRLLPPGSDTAPPGYDDNDMEMQPIRKGRKLRERAAAPSPSPRIMSPMGFAVHRQAKVRQSIIDDQNIYDDDYDRRSIDNTIRPVPIWLCVFLVVGYIIGGAFLFSKWERWNYLDSAYFCFITLTTIGFGDFVPAQGEKEDPQWSIAMCSLYLLFGIALLAMSFNLVQEEVIANVKNVARRLGIIKDDEIEE